MSRVLVAMSGGVDSSVAAALLVEAGHEVVGVTMKTFCYSETPAHSRTCCGLDGIADARRVAAALGIPHFVFDVEEDFTRDVIDDFVAEYAAGRTPNPCVRCNGNTKFRDLMARGAALGCDRIASGHYARVERDGDGRAALLRGLDRSKDQAYFLWSLPPALLERLLLPIGGLTKNEVRARARELGLVTADKPESQEICFVPTGSYRDLLERRLGAHPALEPGPLVRRSGEVVGEHRGYAGFTVGQRKGLGGGFGEPLFVLEIRPETREVVVGTRDELLQDEVVVGEPNWHGDVPRVGARLSVQLRHRAPAVEATVEEVDEVVVLALDEPRAAITPGQSAVLFDGDRLVGGGRIARAGRTARLV
ncbi:MAG TPA: tRNA 2-thiouridine(34) synthase MnmA [Longimicrobiales bacterium]|nr:tRNA 2-thiouridine(34) synthase MnmA [Longimicrobiales bacterium]